MRIEVKVYIPEHLQIEVVTGLCQASCIMCTKDDWVREKGIMTNEYFSKIIERFTMYVDKIKLVSLHLCGEPLLDKYIVNKVLMLKELGFKGIGIATNCQDLNLYGIGLLEAGLDTIICAFDGLTASVYEKIRVGLDYKKVYSNIRDFITLRDNNGYNTKIIIRMVEQEGNLFQGYLFNDFWKSKLSSGDELVRFKVNDWKGVINKTSAVDSIGVYCPYVFRRMVVYGNGNVGLCCLDANGFYNLGNVLFEDPIKIFNNEVFSFYRSSITNNKMYMLNYCAGCPVPMDRQAQKRIVI